MVTQCLTENNSPVQIRGELAQNVRLDQHTSWKIGGLADCVFKPKDIEDLQNFLTKCEPNEPLTFIGLGSNVLVRDGGIRGTVILPQGKLKTLDLVSENTIRAEVGLSCAQVARFAARNHLTQIEYLAGIPGTIGGALAMNAGAFGGETWNNVTGVETINHQGEIKKRSPDCYQIAYRSVRGPEDEWFVAAYFQCVPGDKETSLRAIKSLLEKRRNTQPINVPTCGSVFRNPPGDYAARLIEACGLKGYQVGQASISKKHANFIVNEGNATAGDIETLITAIIRVVQEKFGVVLEPEVVFIGESS